MSMTRRQAMDWGREVFAGGTHKMPQDLSWQAVLDTHKVLVRRMQANANIYPVQSADKATFTMTCRCCGNNV